MKKFIGIAILSLSFVCFGQSKTTAPAKAATPAKAIAPEHAAAKTASAASESTAVTNEEVDSFMKHMFGFESGVRWKVADIGPSEAPGVTRVVVQVGEQSQVIYVLPGGKFAMAGEMIPFGADPF